TFPRGQLKSSARPIGALIDSPLVSTRAAIVSGPLAPAAVRPPPIRSSAGAAPAVSGTAGPTSGRAGGPFGLAPGGTAAGAGVDSTGNATGTACLPRKRLISRSA